jgi:glycosyltransferase involved in cell wall biosynthesis
MASSAVVLASRGSSLTEVIGSDGMQFNPYDTEDIARALLNALSLPEGAARDYRLRCRARAEMFFERADHEPALPGLPRDVAARTT